MPRPGSTTARGYGHDHQKLKRQWQRALKAQGTIPCHAEASGHPHTEECNAHGNTINYGERWHLGHDDHNRDIRTGPERPSCNLRAAATKTNQTRAQEPTRWKW